MAFKLAGIVGALDAGGIVRFEHSKGLPVIVLNGEEYPIDGRSYHGFLETVSRKCKRTETGSLGARNLVIEWSTDNV